MFTLKSKIFAGVFLILITSPTYSQNLNDALRLGLNGLGSNARALGMGNSYLAISDDASAAFFNPAGFGLIKRLEISGGIEHNMVNNEATFFNNKTEYSNSTTQLNRLSFAFPFPTLRGSLVFGLSYHRTKDFTSALKFDGYNPNNNSLIQNLENTDIPYDLFLSDDSGYVSVINGRLQQSGDILAEGSIDNWTFSGAIEIQKNFFIGGNLNIISGNYNSINDYYEDDERGIYTNVETAPGHPNTMGFKTFNLNRVLDWELSGWDFKLGTIYQFNDLARFGVTIQFPKSFTVKEKFTASGSSEFANAFYELDQEYYSDEVEYDVITPFTFGAGFSVNVAGLVANAELSLTDYSQMKFKNPQGISESYFSDQNKNIKEQLGAVLTYNLGAEYTVPTIGLRVRGGYFVVPSAYKKDPSSFDKKYLTAGIGFLTSEMIGIDLGYAHGWWDDIGDNYSGANGEVQSRTFQKVTNDHLMLTFTYRF